MSTLTLFLNAGTWMARTDDPEVITLFECDAIPTAYRSLTPAWAVVEHLRPKWEGYKIVVKECR